VGSGTKIGDDLDSSRRVLGGGREGKSREKKLAVRGNRDDGGSWILGRKWDISGLSSV